MKLTTIKTKFNQEFKLSQLNVLVGPNNVGKSRFLYDIMRLVGHLDKNTLIVNEYDFDPPATFLELRQGLKYAPHPDNPEKKMLRGMGPSLSNGEQIEVPNSFPIDNFNKRDFFSHLNYFARFQIAYLDTTSRLTMALTKDGGLIDIRTPPQNLLQSLYANPDAEEELKIVFRRAFEQDIVLDHSSLGKLILRVDKEIPDIDQRINSDLIQNLTPLDAQGDGMKSFVSVVLSFILAKNRILLIDEPEAFLHGSQQRLLGSLIAEYSKKNNTQVIISTHSSNFLTGLMSTDVEVNILRLNRVENITSFNVINKNILTKLSSNPILSSQPVIESIFYKGVIICEADSDRILYQYVATKEFNEQNVLFIHSYGKDKSNEFVEILRESSVPVHLIVDFDVLNDKHIFKRLLEVFKLSNSQLESFRNKIAQYIESEEEQNLINEIMTKLEVSLNSFKNDNMKNTLTIRSIKREIKNIQSIYSGWEKYKKQGVNGFKGCIICYIDKVISLCEKSGMFIVPCGELESWIIIDVNNKTKWLIKALEMIGENKCPNDLKKFVGRVTNFANYLKPS